MHRNRCSKKECLILWKGKKAYRRLASLLEVMLVFTLLAVINPSGCAFKEVKPLEVSQSSQEDLEATIYLLANRLMEAIRYRDMALSSFALVDGSSIVKNEQSRLSIFVIDQLKQHMIRNNFSAVDIKKEHLKDLLYGRTLSYPMTTCDKNEFPQIILVLNIKDYSTNSEFLYFKISVKKADFNKFEEIVLEEKLAKTPRLLSWLKETVPFDTELGTMENPFEDLDLCAKYLAQEICCPYLGLWEKWEDDDLRSEKINPEEIVLTVVAINRDSEEKIGKFERKLMSKLKHFLIKDCQIENTADFSDFALIDKKIAFYEKEGGFNLNFTAINRERFKPANVLLIAETGSERELINIMLRAAWMKGDIETSYGSGMKVGGTYLKGFAASAYFKGRNIPVERIRISLIFNEDPGAEAAKELSQGFLINKGYEIVGTGKQADLVVKWKIITRPCFRNVDSNCYDFILRKLEIMDRSRVLLRSLPVQDRVGKEKYIGHSQPSEDKNNAIRTGVGMLWGRVKHDFLSILKECF